ncbi:Pentatricopeptide repeat-containing protein [Acorus calamus]|uniref:Pentatricopeptide repeat-containing protein n=1 Tax=Acorus calamus TaxID=4465 RepID=A0AAV9ENA0_ACOCL|nr:Pentatricopeptide repeat-containing protein [Acorus calamus]
MMRNASFTKLLKRTLHNRPPPSSDLDRLREIVLGVGSLDDLESDLNRSGIQVTPSMITQTLESCEADAQSRRLLRFFTWSAKSASPRPADEPFNLAIRAFAAKKDPIALNVLISDFRREGRAMDPETFARAAEALVRCGREGEAVALFKNLEAWVRCPRDRVTLAAIVRALCMKGHARIAEGVVWNHKDRIFIEFCVYESILYGWCVSGNVKEASKVLEQMRSLGVGPKLSSYNSFLSCVCERNVKSNPSALAPDASDIMRKMRSFGVAPSVVSFNILLSCLGRVRRVKEACRVLLSMQGMGCDPDWYSYYLVVRVLFLTGRFGRGNKLVEEVVAEGLVLEPRFFHYLIGVLIGKERVGCALDMLERMKKCCTREYYGPAYDLLIPKLCRGGDFEKGRQLWDEAVAMGVVLQCSSDVLDPSKTEVFKRTRKHEEEPVPEEPVEESMEGPRRIKKDLIV